MTQQPVARVADLVKEFRVGRGRVLRAVDGVSFEVGRGETLGLVGESGSGKTTVARMLIRLEEPTAGRVEFEGRDVTALKGGPLREAVRRRMAMVFQNPSTSLNPYQRIGDVLAEPLKVHGVGDAADRARAVREMMEQVGLDPAFAGRYPQELSGGQRQRVGIARALMLDPSLIVADEPTASLDVSVQAQVVNLLQDLQRDRGLAYLFITHDLALVRHLSHRVAVMYLGRVVEIGPVAALFAEPAHPYTAVLASMQRDAEHRIVPRGDIPSPIDRPSGCAFRSRCPLARERCATEAPALAPVAEGRQAACHFPGELRLAGVDLHRALPEPPPLVRPDSALLTVKKGG
ncbi:oligopeptide/dipeptide ABC transporter ATP-binding protein [Actinocorallia sp. A-T 12471]|uniref:ABC transporter ATP-binding protein n=1 Tax=Actinocorallia sp. A-T 12471 TaxID=3089813 RepID=UPI0029CD6CE5|nr:oligopeptide/dipeptide ABC transporter ATP-binding protein [Actinocorallia sp. A-T 12471]MDX6744076.1 oligopeptide/dipeptide ABC transporter ATP-binding protein [Actinocorallia sp. A-T 12471]